MDMSQHSTHHETVHIIANLDELERKLFAVGQLSFRSYKVINCSVTRLHNNLLINTCVLFLRNGFEENLARSTQLLLLPVTEKGNLLKLQFRNNYQFVRCIFGPYLINNYIEQL